VSIANDIATYTPNTDYTGTDVFTIIATDILGGRTTASVNVTITAVNRAPVATASTVTTDEDITKTFTLPATDREQAATALSYNITVAPNFGTATLNGNSVDYTSNLNSYENDSLTFSVTDAAGLSDTAVVYIVVNSINDPPEADDISLTVQEDGSIIFTFSYSDVEDGTSLNGGITYPTKGTLSTVSLTEIRYTVYGEYSTDDSDSFTYTVYDSAGASATGVVSITIKEVNDLPVVATTSAFTYQASSASFELQYSDAEDSNSELNVAVSSDNAAASFDASTSFVSYQPDPNFFGDDTLVVTITDSDGGMITSAITVTVIPPPPVQTFQFQGDTNYIFVIWSDNNPDYYYRLYSSSASSTDHGDFHKLYESEGETRLFLYDNLPSNSLFYFKLQACIDVNDEASCNDVSAMEGIQRHTPPDLLALNVVFDISDTTIDITMQGATANYYIILATNNDGTELYYDLYAGSTPSFSYSGLSAGARYGFIVTICTTTATSTCRGDSGVSNYSIYTKPPYDTDINLDWNTSDNIARFDWSLIGGAYEYRLTRSTDNTNFTTVYEGGLRSYWDYITERANIYYYRMQICTVGVNINAYPKKNSSFTDSTPSCLPIDHVTIPVLRLGAVLPNTLAVTALSSTQIEVSWSNLESASYYELYRSTASSSGYTLISSGSSTTIIDDNSGSGLTSSTTFYYQLVACVSQDVVCTDPGATTVANTLPADTAPKSFAIIESEAKVVKSFSWSTRNANQHSSWQAVNDCYQLGNSVYYQPLTKTTYRFGYQVYGDWNQLINEANAQQVCGYSDWRVPTVQELQDLRKSVANFEELQLLLALQPSLHWSNQAIDENYGLTVDMLTGGVVLQLLYSYQQLLLINRY